MKPEDVFTPGIFPEHTYVPREEEKFEKLLKNSLSTPGMLTSVLGPSKTGKTVLLQRVVGKKELRVSGIPTSAELWKRVLALLGVAIPESKSTSSTHESTATLGVSDAVTGLAVEATKSSGGGQEATDTFEQAPFDLAVGALVTQDRVLVIDDFHYVKKGTQIAIARQLKEAISRKSKVVVLGVPHGTDDPIRANPDLRGRFFPVDLGSWTTDDLCAIGEIGFPKVGYSISKADLFLLSQEAIGSPQLMQALCLDTCRIAAEGKYTHGDKITLGTEGVHDVCRRTSVIAEARTAFALLSAGPARHGTERTTYNFSGGGTGDVYLVILKALRENPPRQSLGYEDLRTRIARVVSGQPPGSQQWVQALGQLQAIVNEKLKTDRVLEWDPETKIATLADPYFLFFLRWSVWPE